MTRQIHVKLTLVISGPFQALLCYAVNNQTFCGMTGGFLALTDVRVNKKVQREKLNYKSFQLQRCNPLKTHLL